MQKPIEKFDDWEINIAEQTVIDALDTRNADHNKNFI